MTTSLSAVADPRIAQEHSFRTSDGVELFYRHWPAVEPQQAATGPGESAQPRAIILFHRGHEHSARWQDVVDKLRLPGCALFAWDARGHGRSPGDRGYGESFGRFVRDAHEFVQHVSRTYYIAIPDLAVIAQSVGAVIAAAWLHDYAPPIRAVVLATPAFRVKLYVPLAIPGLRLLQKIRERAFIRSYVKPGLLTHDREQAAQYASDPLISPQIAVNILLGLYDTSARVVNDAGAIVAPVQLLVSGRDWVVDDRPQFRFIEQLSSYVRECVLYPEFFHSTFWEKDREQPIAAAREFILRQFSAGLPTPSLIHADESSASRLACDRIRRKLPPWSLKRWWYFGQWLGMQTVGRLSKGVRVGWARGYDSGESLDHVYKNTAEGISPLGRLIDRVYLDAPGWRGIRQRKVHMQAMLERALMRITEQRIASAGSGNSGIHILDIAAGPGRYLLEFLRKHAHLAMTATLRDRSETGLAAGRALAQELGVQGVTYEAGDAFDESSLATVSPGPSIAIVSGLYELFPANAPLRRSLRGLAATVRRGGILIYTNQPWHPQHEMIARVLPNRDGEPWVMRCRSQAEMDQLVEEAGFSKVDMLIDDEGIFSVSMAVRQ